MVISIKTEATATAIVDSVVTVHRELGPGLLERVYETCLIHELRHRSLYVERQVAVPIQYRTLTFPDVLRLDLLVNHEIICELKAAWPPAPVWKAQLISYLKLTGMPLGFLINFHVPLAKDGISRVILKR